SPLWMVGRAGAGRCPPGGGGVRAVSTVRVVLCPGARLSIVVLVMVWFSRSVRNSWGAGLLSWLGRRDPRVGCPLLSDFVGVAGLQVSVVWLVAARAPSTIATTHRCLSTDVIGDPWVIRSHLLDPRPVLDGVGGAPARTPRQSGVPHLDQ